MPRFKFAKLVRDRIVDHQIASGAKPAYRYLSDAEHKQELVNKIIEEAREIIHAKEPEEVAAEIADVQQALDDLKIKYALTEHDISREQSAKNAKNGSFTRGLYVEYIDISSHDPWVDYYREHPDRYPEV